MKKLVSSVFALVLFASPALSQSMRSYQSEKRFVGKGLYGDEVYVVFGNGSVHVCGYDIGPGASGECIVGKKIGIVNRRFRNYPMLNEFYLENKTLIRYSCFEGNNMQCSTVPEKEVLRPL